MLRTFHINSAINQNSTLNISECNNNKEVTLSIKDGEQTAEIVLDYEAFEDLCGLKYSLDLVESDKETIEAESAEITLCEAA